MKAALDTLVGRNVVLDTEGPFLYLGRLGEVTDHGFWLEDADVHDRDEGHASKESYVFEAKLHGIHVNRTRVFVMRTAVVSISALDDVAVDE